MKINFHPKFENILPIEDGEKIWPKLYKTAINVADIERFRSKFSTLRLDELEIIKTWPSERLRSEMLHLVSRLKY